MEFIMTDQDIRKALKLKCLRRYSKSNFLIIDELSLLHGYSRIDVAVMGKTFIGYEIKSDCDKLVRLNEQIRIYNLIFDKIYLIVGYNLACQAIKKIPDWWGIKLVSQGPKGGIYFSEARKPSLNPLQNKLAIAKLLWREEALAVLEELKCANNLYSKTRRKIYSKLAEVADIRFLKNKVFQSFIKRNLTVAVLHKSYDD
jgi:hypothetical protein